MLVSYGNIKTLTTNMRKHHHTDKITHRVNITTLYVCVKRKGERSNLSAVIFMFNGNILGFSPNDQIHSMYFRSNAMCESRSVFGRYNFAIDVMHQPLT